MQTTTAEYTVEEMRSYLADMAGKYDLARVVDPTECRILDFREDGSIRMDERCYGIWSSEQRCANCSSAVACKTRSCQEKAERFNDQLFLIQSNPVSLRLRDGSVYDAVVELVRVEQDASVPANDRAAESAAQLARYDSLTHVLNADAFYEAAREKITDYPQTAWMMISADIMNFRLVNNLFGDLKGNAILVRTAAALRAITDAAGGVCGRLGGDRFALLLPKAAYSEDALKQTAAALSDTFSCGLYTFCLQFGVYRIDEPSLPVSVLCGRANSALHTIRGDMTRTVAYCNDALLQQLLLEQTVIGSFEQALEAGQLRMYLQPLVDADGAVVGAEALARWFKPDGTILAPSDFIETLENAGLIHKLDAYMWELAAKQLRAWKGTDKAHLFISVNMSAKDLFSMNVYDTLTALAEKYGVDSRLLRLEITETALLVEPEKSNAAVAKLRERGFVVEIDDFGKGYSSLGLLKHLQADVLKIDMSFLHEIEVNARSRIILQAVISLAEALGMELITEGVETAQQLAALTEMGCRRFQGFYFAKPLPIEEFTQLVCAPLARI